MIAIAINALLGWSLYRFAKHKTNHRRWAMAMDVLLLHYFVQYAAVCILGLAGILTFTTLYTLVAIIAAGTIYLTRNSSSIITIEESKNDRLFIGGCAAVDRIFLRLDRSVRHRAGAGG